MAGTRSTRPGKARLASSAECRQEYLAAGSLEHADAIAGGILDGERAAERHVMRRIQALDTLRDQLAVRGVGLADTPPQLDAAIARARTVALADGEDGSAQLLRELEEVGPLRLDLESKLLRVESPGRGHIRHVDQHELESGDHEIRSFTATALS